MGPAQPYAGHCVTAGICLKLWTPECAVQINVIITDLYPDRPLRLLVDIEKVYQPASLPLCDSYLESHCRSIACGPGWSIKIEDDRRRLRGQAVLRCEFIYWILPRPALRLSALHCPFLDGQVGPTLTNFARVEANVKSVGGGPDVAVVD